MLRLYHNDMSVCAQKARLALAELQLDWESCHIKLRSDEQLRPEYLRINPKGQVPALVDGDIVVVESTVINEYLADAHGGGSLCPDTAAGRAKMRWWTRQLDDDVHRSTGVISVSIAFLHQYLANTPEMLGHILKSTPEEARRELKRQAFGAGLNNPELPVAVRRMDKLLGDMDAALADSEWLAGDTISLADIGLTSYVLRLEHLQQAFMFEGRLHLAAWFERVKERPSFKEAIVKWLNPDYLPLMERTGKEARPRLEAMLNG